MATQLQFDFMKDLDQCVCNGAGCQCSIPTQNLIEHNREMEAQERYDAYLKRMYRTLDPE